MRQKGTPKTGGRQKGSKNKVSSELKDWISGLVDRNREAFESDLQSVDPEKRLQIMERLFQYIVPKAQAIDAKIDFGKLTEEQLELVINQLLRNIEDGE